MDRVALKYTINPLDEKETKEMIEFRLRQAGHSNVGSLFSEEAVNTIYQYTQGYPRKISMICHDALETIVMNEKNIVDMAVVKDLITRREDYEG
jgi:general secretion pathway protein A